MARNVYQVITDKILKLLDEGTVPWHKPWKSPVYHPKNLVSGKKYRGVNAFCLAFSDFDSPYWLTYKQAKDRGGSIKKGEKGSPCVYWNWTEIVDRETGEIQKKPFIRYYQVFNVEQATNVDYPEIPSPQFEHTPIEACEKVIAKMPKRPEIKHSGPRASYHPIDDYIRVPNKTKFEKPEFYYGTLFHELTHSTGHASRLSRIGITQNPAFGTQKYSKEELVAEMGTAFLCGHTGIEAKVIDNSASYIDGWRRKISKDAKLVIFAGAQAQKAADYILGIQYGADKK